MQVLLAPASCYGDPVTATKNGETRYVPMIPELGQMLAELRKERANEPLTATVMRVFECQNSMTHAAAKIGMKRINPSRSPPSLRDHLHRERCGYPQTA
jgi:hypothetical protein